MLTESATTRKVKSSSHKPGDKYWPLKLIQRRHQAAIRILLYPSILRSETRVWKLKLLWQFLVVRSVRKTRIISYFTPKKEMDEARRKKVSMKMSVRSFFWFTGDSWQGKLVYNQVELTKSISLINEKLMIQIETN